MKHTKPNCWVKVRKFTYLAIYIYNWSFWALHNFPCQHIFLILKFDLFFFLNIYSLLSQTKNSSRYASETKRRTAEAKATVQGQNDRSSPFDKTKLSTSPFNITHQTQNIYTLSNTNPSYFTESLQGYDHGSQRFQSST